MKILVTGAKGFIGKNLIAELRNQGYSQILEYDADTKEELLDDYTAHCDFVFHLAGVNRPPNAADFMAGNFGFTSTLLESLQKHQNRAPVLVTSSVQAEQDSPYGRSKKAGEELLLRYAEQTGAPVYLYRLPNVFGKWCRPNYNSVVATFCHNIARGLPIVVNDPSTRLTLVYIDDLIRELFGAMGGAPTREGVFCRVAVTHTATLGELSELLYSFHAMRETLLLPDLAQPFVKKLHATYLSYLPEDGFSYPLTTKADQRGSFTELIRTGGAGQFSVNLIKPHVVKGNHWHHTKNEKFIVVSGRGVIRFRKIDSKDVIEYHVSDEKLEMVDIPTGYTHNIENLGEGDMVTMMWCNECFDPQNPDTFYEEV